jgi:Sec7-like guanine-nucleotide exchange factor
MDGPGEAIEDGPTATDREQAQKLFDSQDQVVGSDPAAAWLGDPDRATVREAYMRLFDWSNFNILAALRSLCERLVLKGETQQVDRVLDAFSNRWCDCNPSHGFKATGKF